MKFADCPAFILASVAFCASAVAVHKPGAERVRGRQRVFIGMVRGSIFRQQLGCAVAGVVRVGKAVVDHKRLAGILFSGAAGRPRDGQRT